MGPLTLNHSNIKVRHNAEIVKLSTTVKGFSIEGEVASELSRLFIDYEV